MTTNSRFYNYFNIMIITYSGAIFLIYYLSFLLKKVAENFNCLIKLAETFFRMPSAPKNRKISSHLNFSYKRVKNLTLQLYNEK